IDAEADDWQLEQARTYDDAGQVVSGSSFWDGPSDASFEVAADADEGYFYLWVDVTDDVVIDAGSEEVMADGVVVTLRDPRLEAVVDALPATMSQKEDFSFDASILFTPDGQFWSAERGESALNRAGLEAEAKKTDEGYRIEAAFSVEVLEQVAELPLDEIGFRVELMDGDEPDRRGEQTRMNMLPGGGDRGRVALFDVDRLLPHLETASPPPRPGALGRWKRGDEAWTFESAEVVSDLWHPIEDVSEFEETLADTGVFRDVCPSATRDRILQGAYESSQGGHRAGLVMCGARAPGGHCPESAESHLHWVHLKREQREWQIVDHDRVTEKPLRQCTDRSPTGDDHYTDFSFVPLDMVTGSLWGIGWTRTFETGSERRREEGVWLLNTRAEEPIVGEAQLFEERALVSERIRSESRAYLTPLDRNEGLDLCAVERKTEERCQGIDQNCTAGESGQLKRVHIDMWKPDEARFESYLLAEHDRCDTNFDFAERKGYMLLYEDGRLGVLPSPAN
ncbi:MAG: sugar-binding protein, partial [Persicimonas sp.]